MATKRQAVATTQDKLPVFVEDRPDFVQDTMRGNEDVRASDITIPRLDILQALSPQIDESEPKYIEGAKQGGWFNTVTNQLYGERVFFVPCYFRMEYVVWKDINKGGGFRGAFESAAEAQAEVERIDDGPDCEVVDTGQQFGLVLHEDGSVEEIVLSCSKTKHKPSRKLNTLSKMRGGDRFASVYELKVVPAENAAGQKFWNFDLRALGWVPEEVYKRAEALYEAVRSGARDVDRRQQEGGGEGVVSPDDLDS